MSPKPANLIYSRHYLSGAFHDAVFGQNQSLTLSASNGGGESVSLTSSVIPAADLASQQTVSLSFANVAPPVGHRHHAKSAFSSTVSGDMSAAGVPEPASPPCWASACSASASRLASAAEAHQRLR